MKKLSIVIPVYNEEQILESELGEITVSMNELLPSVDYEILVVENGSSDNTPKILQKISEKNTKVRALSLPAPSYGNALKEGILNANAQFLAIFNIDFWNVEFIKKSLPILENNADVVSASKTMRGAEDSRPFVRRCITKSFNLFLKIFFGFRGTDTHGIKVLNRDRILPILNACITDREIFDTELLIRAQKAGLIIKELPVECEEKRSGATGILKRIPRTAVDLLRLSEDFHDWQKLLHKYFLPVVLLLVLLLCFWNFQTNPGFWFDEGIVSQLSKHLALYGEYGVQVSPGMFFTQNFWITVGYSVTLPIAFLIKIFGVKIWVARLVPLLYLLGLIIVSHLFIKRLFGFNTALWSTLLLASFSPLYGNGKAVLGETPALFWIFLGGLIYLLYEKRRGMLLLFLSGLFFGIAIGTKPYFLLLCPALAVFLFWAWLKQKSIKLKQFLIFSLGCSLPVFTWLFTILDLSTYHKFKITLSYFLNSYGAEAGSFGSQIIHNLLKFVSESTPIHFTVLSVVILSALFIKRKYISEVHPLLLSFIVFVLLSFVWYLKTPGWYRYFYSIHVIVILFFPVALISLFNKRRIVMLIFLGLFAFQTAYLLMNYNRFNSDNLLVLKNYMEEMVDENESVFVVSKPEVAFVLNHKNLYQLIFINKNLIIGEDVLQSESPDYLIMDYTDDFFFGKNKEFIDSRYAILKDMGHYRVYKLRF